MAQLSQIASSKNWKPLFSSMSQKSKILLSWLCQFFYLSVRWLIGHLLLFWDWLVFYLFPINNSKSDTSGHSVGRGERHSWTRWSLFRRTMGHHLWWSLGHVGRWSSLSTTRPRKTACYHEKGILWWRIRWDVAGLGEDSNYDFIFIIHSDVLVDSRELRSKVHG